MRPVGWHGPYPPAFKNPKGWGKPWSYSQELDRAILGVIPDGWRPPAPIRRRAEDDGRTDDVREMRSTADVAAHPQRHDRRSATGGDPLHGPGLVQRGPDAGRSDAVSKLSGKGHQAAPQSALPGDQEFCRWCGEEIRPVIRCRMPRTAEPGTTYRMVTIWSTVAQPGYLCPSYKEG